MKQNILYVGLDVDVQLEPIGDVPPAEFEQANYNELERQAIVA
jgi:hypothetical protein